ncbi:MAG TPA: hypothetical protein VJT49_15490 [Amycolatopsis sp.]|uniref:hypothetical protein n=1 Tax=Amycolatopsis sp. TaxID=37632 RepID=UPI002B48D98A|nr:hypothetical protein [Amycolatopsis sp.]HKS46481.1 hypothetical protein [Amycolatopsis sp.]
MTGPAARVQLTRHPSPAHPTPESGYEYKMKDLARKKLVGVADVYADRGQTVDVGDVCARSAHTRKERTAVR